MSEKPIMNVEEFLKEFSISRSSFYAEVRQKKLKIRKRGSRTYVLRTDAVEWMNALPVAEVP